MGEAERIDGMKSLIKGIETRNATIAAQSARLGEADKWLREYRQRVANDVRGLQEAVAGSTLRPSPLGSDLQEAMYRLNKIDAFLSATKET